MSTSTLLRKARPIGLHAEVVLVTPALAEGWLGKNIQNRPLRRAKIAGFSRDMRSGAWLLTGEPIKFDTNGRLIDGQHRLLALIDSGATVQMLVVTGLDEEVKAVLDTGSARTPGDMLGIVAGTRNASAIAAIARLAVAWDHGFRWFNNYKPTHAQILDYVTNPLNAHIHRAAEVGGYGSRYVACKPSILGLSFYLCARRDRPEAEEFFVTQLIESTGLAAGDPAQTLNRKLALDADKIGQTADFNKLAYILTAWNHYRAGTKTTRLIAPKGVGWTHETFPMPR